MGLLKQILKVAVALIAGIAIGLLLGGIVAVAFTDVSFGDFVGRLSGIDLSEGLLVLFVAFAAVGISLLLLIMIHEAGHLVCGLATGYKFVSFRTFNLTVIRQNKKFAVKHFAVAGTGGQCLLSPPDVAIDRIPTGWYNFGGVLANLVALTAAVALLWTDLHPLMREAVATFCLMDGFVILLNGIPMKAGGIGNDAYNMMKLRHDPEGKRGVILQLRTNALIQEGVRPKDMPDDWFEMPHKVDYRNPLQVSIPLAIASRAIDRMDWEEAYDTLNSLYAHKEEIMALYVNEIACELLFVALITGRKSQAEELWTEPLKKYVETYGKVMSSKMRLLAAVELYINGDREKAEAIYNRMVADSEKYLLQGEVKSDLAIMRRMLERA